jgi:CheY-like chemotaxis protein
MTGANVRRVLCVDDDAEVLELLRTVLEPMGFEVVTCGDGLEALARWRAGKFDLLVSDLLLPKLDGIKLAEKIRADDPSARILVITAIAHSLAKELAAAPINGYLPKPLSLPRFKAKVQELLPS